MPNKWKKKNPEKEIPSNNKILQAVELVCKENKSIREVALSMKISKSALARHVQKYKLSSDKNNIIFMKNLQGSLVFPIHHENMLTDYLLTASKMHYGLTKSQVCILAYQYAENLHVDYPVSWKINQKAGPDWFKGFMNRHSNLTLRSPEATSLGRATSFNKFNVNAFLNNLKSVYERFKFPSSRIYNCDETGVSTAHNPPKVIAAKGVKQVGQVTSFERGELVTVLFVVNALGNTVPPVFIFPRVRNKDLFLKGDPTNSLALASRSGWMTSELFPLALDHIIKHTNPSKEHPILLLLDNHDSHVNIQVINKAKESGICLLTFPPHCSHRLQPLDVSVFSPFKSKYNVVCNDWLINNPGKTITIYSTAELVGKAYLSVVTPKNIISGFEKTGIWPYDSEPFTDEDYLMSSVTDRAAPTNECTVNNSQLVSNYDGLDSEIILCTTPSTSVNNSQIVANYDGLDSEIISCSTPSTSKQVNTTIISPADIRPYPKAVKRKFLGTLRGRMKGRTKILTDTPEKEAIEKEAAEKLNRKIKKPKLQKTTKQKRFVDTSSDENVEISTHEITDDEISTFSISEDDNCVVKEIDWATDSVSIGLNDFVLIKFCTKKSIIHYVGRVETVDNLGFTVQYLRKKERKWTFCFPPQVDRSFVEKTDVLLRLPAPQMIGGTERAQSLFSFKIDLSSYNVR